MMPFYPYYYKQLSEGGTSHIASAKYTPPVPAATGKSSVRDTKLSIGRSSLFEWDKNRYKVYGKDGKLLCDAIFGTDGIIEGYGQKKYTDETHPDWNIVEEGN